MEFWEWLMETMAENAFHIVGKNLKRTSVSLSKAAEKSFAHLGEQAYMLAKKIAIETGYSDVVSAILTADDAARIYRESFPGGDADTLFADVNRSEEPYFKRTVSRLYKLYLCDAIAALGKKHDLSSLASMICGEMAPFPTEKEKTVAFLRNGQASRAFECFAKHLGGVSAVYENNFLNACESVYSDQATYAIIPIYNTADGRLGSFYRQIEKYGLSIVLTCDIDSDDGENTTTFALLYKAPLYPETEGEPLYECKITFDDLNMLADITDAASYYGADIRSIDALPMIFSGRANTFSIVFGLQNANVNGFFSYLALEYPQTAAVGIYRNLSRAVI